MLRVLCASRPAMAAFARSAAPAPRAAFTAGQRVLTSSARSAVRAPAHANAPANALLPHAGKASTALAAPSLALSRVVQARAYSAGSATSRSSLAKFAAAASFAGIGGLTVYALSSSAANFADLSSHSQQVQQNIKATYAYVMGGLGVTAVMATSMFRSGLHHRIAAYNPWLVMGVSIAGLIGTMIATQAIPYQNYVPKHAAWLGFNACMATSLCSLGVVGSPIIIKAAVGTAAIVGSLSLIAFANPERTFLKMTGPLTIGLGTMFAASIGTMFFPGSALLQGFVLYGGLGLFGFMVLHDTQAIIARAEYDDIYNHDPINSSIGIYLDTIQIFWRLVAIMSGNRRK
eukprot:TRINITY_DN1972_c0_g1_i1.p1 TRINITY_DN1972_c0_g1~~TRINITY_DN1972_c0_g1_i1.p1  ORF type:complete len:378 (-),score=109.55 TRINITY_DN1972_c0_g1_i1:250-1287(-)